MKTISQTLLTPLENEVKVSLVCLEYTRNLKRNFQITSEQILKRKPLKNNC